MLIPLLFVFEPDNLGEDCPVFENLFEFCQIYAGGTIGNLTTRVLFLEVWVMPVKPCIETDIS